MFTLRQSRLPLAWVALLVLLINLVSGEDCDDSKKEIGKFAKALLEEIEKKVCAKCKVHMNDLEKDPHAMQYVKNEIMNVYGKDVKGDLPVSEKEYDDIMGTVMDKCINKYKGKELCKEMKPKEGEIKSCIIQNCMFKIDIGKLQGHLEKYCKVMKAFFAKHLNRYKGVISGWPAKHKNACP